MVPVIRHSARPNRCPWGCATQVQRAELKFADDRVSCALKTRYSLRPLSHDRGEILRISGAYRPGAARSDQRLALGCHGGTDEKGSIATGLEQSAAKVSADRTGADDENSHNSSPPLLVPL